MPHLGLAWQWNLYSESHPGLNCFFFFFKAGRLGFLSGSMCCLSFLYSLGFSPLCTSTSFPPHPLFVPPFSLRVWHKWWDEGMRRDIGYNAFLLWGLGTSLTYVRLHMPLLKRDTWPPEGQTGRWQVRSPPVISGILDIHWRKNHNMQDCPAFAVTLIISLLWLEHLLLLMFWSVCWVSCAVMWHVYYTLK